MILTLDMAAQQEKKFQEQAEESETHFHPQNSHKNSKSKYIIFDRFHVGPALAV